MTVLVDTAVVMYATGADHPLKQPCVELLELVAEGAVSARMSAELIQEVLHRYTHGGASERGAAIAERALRLLGPPVPFDDGVARRLIDLVRAHPDALARDLVHVATCLENGFRHIVSPDQDFDRISSIERIDPTNTEAIDALL